MERSERRAYLPFHAFQPAVAAIATLSALVLLIKVGLYAYPLLFGKSAGPTLPPPTVTPIPERTVEPSASDIRSQPSSPVTPNSSPSGPSTQQIPDASGGTGNRAVQPQGGSGTGRPETIDNKSTK